MAGRKHLMAVNRSIKSLGLDADGDDAALCVFMRDQARELDEKGIDGVSARLISAYQSGLVNLKRAAVRKPVAKAPEPAVSKPAESDAPVAGAPAALHIVEESPLEKLRNKKKHAS